MNNVKYCVLFPEAENVHLTKDVGMIAYKLNKLFGADASVVSYNNDRYFYLDNEVKGLKIEFLNRRYNNHILDGMAFLIGNSKKIDVLQLFHVTLRSFIFTLLYKFFNRKGKVFLKLDCTEELIKKITLLKGLGEKVLNFFLSRVFLIGIERKELKEKLSKVIGKHKDKLIYIPNGIDYNAGELGEGFSFSEKENIILTVGRLGSPEKRTDILLNAFAEIKDIENSSWELILVGPVEESFNEFIIEFFKNHPMLQSKTKFTGAIYNKSELFSIYKKSKIFCLSSESESFSIALLEAAAHGNALVSTNVGIASEFIQNDGGVVIQKPDSVQLSNALKEMINCNDIEGICKRNYAKCREEYDWNTIVQRLFTALDS